ncbi:hypothetical protein C0J52_26590 [Blattella germanica]|nr:hypothetical protein C0J52_26590 [Blattella germanica]
MMFIFNCTLFLCHYIISTDVKFPRYNTSTVQYSFFSSDCHCIDVNKIVLQIDP